mgnify:CR=1 FL=1
MERLEKTENPGLVLVNRYWELMTCDIPEKSRKAAASWLKWDTLGASVVAQNGIDNPNSTTSNELLTSNEDIVKLGLSFYRSLNSAESDLNSKNFLEMAVAKINGKTASTISIESRKELVRSLPNKIRLITGEFDMLCPPAFAHEVIEKLSIINPPTLGAASRISGVTPPAIIALLRHVKRKPKKRKLF